MKIAFERSGHFGTNVRGGVQPSLTNGRHGASRRFWSKILLTCLALTMFLAGCSNGGSTAETDSFNSDYDTQTAIKTQIEDTAIPRGYATLLVDGSDYLTVLVSDGEASVTVKTFMNYTIPYTAEVWLPIAQQAVEDAGATLSKFTVYYSTKTSDGDTVIAQWETKDGETGTLVDQIGLDLRFDDNTIKTGQTIDQLFEYYAEYDSIVNGMIVEGGGAGYER